MGVFGTVYDGIIIMMEERRNSLVQWFLKNPSARTFIFQFLSTVFLTFMCLSTVNLPPFQGHPHDRNPFHMITVALIVYSIICFSGPISGAHINPAVTLAVYSSKKLQKGDWKMICSYVVGQIFGCTLGCIFSKMFFDQGGPVYMEFPQGLDLLKDCTQEFIGTFLLIMFVLIMSNEETSFVNSEAWVHLLIGVVYYYCLTYATHLHFINPAIQFSFQFQGMMFIDGIEANTLLACLYVAFAQCLGAWVSQYVFHKKYLKQAKFWKDQFR